MVFPTNFHDINYTKFLITLLLCIWFWKSLLDITYTISIHNHYMWSSTKYIRKKKEKKKERKIGSIVSPKLNGDRCMRSFSSITIF